LFFALQNILAEHLNIKWVTGEAEEVVGDTKNAVVEAEVAEEEEVAGTDLPADTPEAVAVEEVAAAARGVAMEEEEAGAGVEEEAEV
jgi:hypothetical protein